MNKKEAVKEILGILVDLQMKDEGQLIGGCAPIEVQIGTVINNTVHDGYVIIKNAPACVVDKLNELGYSMSIGNDGVSVYKL